MPVTHPESRLAARLATSRKRNHQQEADLVKLHDAGEHTTAELGELVGVARSTVYRSLIVKVFGIR